MEMNDLTLWLMILFNAGFCLILPRMLTLNWLKMLRRFTAEPPAISSEFFTKS